MIKFFGIYPLNLDLSNLHEVQKIFMIYLAGTIPKEEDWIVNVRYHKEKSDVDIIEHVDLTDSDIDMAKIKGNNIELLKESRLLEYKERLYSDLNKKYGIDINENEEKSETKLTDSSVVEKSKSIHEGLQKRIINLISKKPEKKDLENGRA